MDPSVEHTILITGGGGFVGQQLARGLLDSSLKIKSIVLTDIVEPQIPFNDKDKKVVSIKSDITTPEGISILFEGRQYTSICVLHGLMSGGSEANFDLGWTVNFDSTRALLEYIRHLELPKAPTLLFTSSGACFGGTLPPVIEDETPCHPQGSYGVQKLMCESLVYEYTRRGWIDGRSVRLPTVTVRAGKPNTALSSYASNIIREPLKGEPATSPVPLDFPVFISNPKQLVKNLITLLQAPAEKFPHGTRTVNMPGITTSTKEMLEALEKVGGKAAVDLVTIKSDPSIRKIVDTWAPRFNTQRAYSLGLESDKTVLEAVEYYKSELDAGRG